MLFKRKLICYSKEYSIRKSTRSPINNDYNCIVFIRDNYKCIDCKFNSHSLLGLECRFWYFSQDGELNTDNNLNLHHLCIEIESFLFRNKLDRYKYDYKFHYKLHTLIKKYI